MSYLKRLVKHDMSSIQSSVAKINYSSTMPFDHNELCNLRNSSDKIKTTAKMPASTF